MIEKGYPIESGYMGLINEKYMLFETEEAYKEYLFELNLTKSERYVCSLINKRKEF